MGKYIIILLLLFLSACEQNKSSEQKEKVSQPKMEEQKYDFLKWDEVKINGRIPLFTNHTEVKEKLGNFDSVSSNMDDCGMYFWNRTYKKVFVRGIEFEATTDSLVFRSVDFGNSNVFLSTPKFRLDKNTTTEDLQKFFPNSFTDIRQKEIYGVGMMKIIQLNLNDNYNEDMWLLFFDDKKLIRIEYWISC